MIGGGRFGSDYRKRLAERQNTLNRKKKIDAAKTQREKAFSSTTSKEPIKQEKFVPATAKPLTKDQEGVFYESSLGGPFINKFKDAGVNFGLAYGQVANEVANKATQGLYAVTGGDPQNAPKDFTAKGLGGILGKLIPGVTGNYQGNAVGGRPSAEDVISKWLTGGVTKGDVAQVFTGPTLGIGGKIISNVATKGLPIPVVGLGAGGSGSGFVRVGKSKVEQEVLDLTDDVFDPVKKAADEAAKEVEDIPKILGNVEDIIPTDSRLISTLKFDDATWESAINNLQNKTDPTDANVGAAMLAILNYGPDALRQIDEPLVQRLSGIVESGAIPKFEWGTSPSKLEQRVADTMADVSRVFEQPKSTTENVDLTDILRNTLSRLGGSNAVSADYDSPVFSIARRVADLEDVPLRISASLPKGGIFTFPIDHNPIGLGAIRETGNRAVNEGLIKADFAAKGMVDIIKALRSSGIAIPAELNKLLGTDARWSSTLPAWSRAYEKLPNLSDAWIDAGLLDEYANNAKRLTNISDEANSFLELYKRFAKDPNWLSIINSR